MRHLSTALAPLRRRLWWHRRLLTALAAGLCVLACLRALSPAPAPTVPVLVTTRDLPGGTTLQEGDVEVRHVPRDVLPGRAVVEPRKVVGRMLAGSQPRGVMLTELSVVSPALAAASPGHVLSPLRIDDPQMVALLSVGDRVDVVAPGPDGARVVAKGARIVAIPAATPAEGGIAPAAQPRGTLVVLEVARAEATAVLQAQAGGRVMITLT